MRLALLIALLLASPSVLADPVTLVMLAGSYMVQYTAFVITGYALMIGASLYGAAEQRKKADAQARAARQAYNDSLKDRTATRVATDAPLRTVYGRARVGSDIVAMFTNGAKDEYKYLVCVHAAHECEAIEEIWVNNIALGTLTTPDLYGCQEIDPSQISHPYFYKNTISVDSEVHTGTVLTLDHIPVENSVRCVWGSGDHRKVQKPTSVVGAVVTVPTSRTYTVHYDYIEYISRVRVTKHLGTPTDVADPSLALLFPDKWSANSLLRDLCYTVIRLDLNQQEFQSGVPPIEVLIKGKKVLDLRSMTSTWSENPALCIYDYLTGDLCGVAGDSLYHIGTAQAAAPNSLTLAASANTTDDYYKNGKVFITGGAGASQSRNILTSRRNYLLYSQKMNVVNWVSAFTRTADAATAPDGTLTADKFLIPVGYYAGGIQVHQSVYVTTGQTYTWSTYAKKINASYNSIALFCSGGNRTAKFNLDTLVTSAISGCTATATALDDGWVRCSITFTIPATATLTFYTYAQGFAPVTGDGVGGYYLWGAQLESSDAVTEYVESEGAQAVGVAVDEPWSSNLLTYSQAFDNAAWPKIAMGGGSLPVVTADFGEAPDGTMTADRIQFARTTTGATDYSLISRSIASLTGTKSIYLKSNTGAVQYIAMYLQGTYQELTVTTDWQRFDVPASASLWFEFGIFETTAQQPLSADVLVWGAQSEISSVVTPYIATTSAAILPLDSTSLYEVVVQAADIPVDDYITAANVCDESITIDGAAAPRYTLNGVVTSDQPQKRVLEQMVQAMAGTLVETTWSISAGKYVAPVMALDQSDIVGPLSVMSGTPDADLYNSVRAQYVSAENGYVSTDCAPYQNAVYLLADGKESWNDVQLPFTDKKQRIHNLARIMMEDQRNGMTVRASMSLKVWRLRISDRVLFTSSFLGQASKIYRITDRRFSPDQMIELTMKEDSSLIWDEADAVLVDETVNTNLPNPFIVGLCGNVQMTEMLYETTGSAGVKAGAILTWDAPADVSVIDYELEYKSQTSGVWIELANIRATRYLFEDIAPGIYDFRVKARNIFNVVGQYTDIKSFEVFGLNTPPADVTNFTVKPFGGMALCKWDRTQDLDVKIGGDVEIRFSPVSSATWANASLIPDGENNGDASNAIVSLATGTYFAKFKDSSGNYSLNAASFVVTEALVTGWTTVFTSTQHTGFTGTKTNCTVTAGILYLDSGQLSAEYLFSARLDMTTSISRRFHARINSYSSVVGDTIDARLTNIDTWSSFDGSVVDDTNAVVDIAISDDDVTYSTWMPFMVADFKCRYAKFRLRMTSGVVTHTIQVSELEVLVKV